MNEKRCAMRQCILVLALFFLSALLSAQSYQGGLRGSVEDPAGSAITIGKVTLKDEATNLSRSTLTNDLGEFVFQSVNPATYSVAIESPGFARLERSGVIIATQSFL